MRTRNRKTIDPGDKSALERVLEGDPDAFRHFLDKYGRHVERVLARHLPAQSLPDAAQEVFVRAYGSLAGFDGERPFGAWVTTIALRCCYDRLRRMYARREVSAGSMDSDARTWVSHAAVLDPGRDMNGQELWEVRQLLDYALDRIHPRDRLVLSLTVVEGHTSAEAADLLEMSEANVRVRAFRAKRKLRNILEKLMEEES